jgi:hypothetical protein
MSLAPFMFASPSTSLKLVCTNDPYDFAGDIAAERRSEHRNDVGDFFRLA